MKNSKIVIVAVFLFFIGNSAYTQTVRPASNDEDAVRSYQDKNVLLKATQEAIERRQSTTLGMIQNDSIPAKANLPRPKNSKPAIHAKNKAKPQE